MPASRTVLTRPEFTRLVRDALNRLYDSSSLETHPLTRLLVPAAESKARAGQELRRILLNAIQSLHPEKWAPSQSHDWRSYRILELRYITGLSSAEAMQRLALGRSLFFLEQAHALKALVDRLWLRAQPITEEAQAPDASRTTTLPETIAEVDRLLQSTDWEILDLSDLVEQLQPVIQALVQSQKGKLSYEIHRLGPIEHSNRVLLRQVILNLVFYGLKVNPAGYVQIKTVDREGSSLIILVNPSENPRTTEVPDPGQGMSLELCQRCIQAMGGTLQVGVLPGEAWQARLFWPSTGPLRLLVIDDYPDFIELVRRYLDGQRWQVFGAGDGEAARKVIDGALPDAILLDVILPKEDGWELLLSLKTGPETRSIPVIVCSALDEPGLVAALGGSAFLAKPLNRQTLLEALKRAAPADSSQALTPPE
jgi:CheY-like chemotaxis protein/signal transduction histidine kinase